MKKSTSKKSTSSFLKVAALSIVSVTVTLGITINMNFWSKPLVLGKSNQATQSYQVNPEHLPFIDTGMKLSKIHRLIGLGEEFEKEPGATTYRWKDANSDFCWLGKFDDEETLTNWRQCSRE